MPRPSIALLLFAGTILALPAAAQSPPAQPPSAVPPGSVGATANGAPPVQATSTSAVGRTKPPGAAADGTRPDLDEKSRQLDRRIRTGICSGC